jgi:hypothetical protein
VKGPGCEYNPFWYDCRTLQCADCPERTCRICREWVEFCTCEPEDDDYVEREEIDPEDDYYTMGGPKK